MKKILLTTTLLVATAGVAAAEVTLSGSGRFGLTYNSDAPGGVDGTNETQLSYRLRINIDASKETDSGITFGGRIRLQYDNGDDDGDNEAGAELSAAYLYAEASGFRMEVGNANGAFDSLGTLYNSELGYIGTTQGSYNLAGPYASFSSGPFDVSEDDRVGIFVSYDVGGLSAKASYHTPDQTDSNLGTDIDPITDLPFATGDEEEYSIAVDYAFNQFKIGAGYVKNGGFIDGNEAFAVTGEYAVNDTTNVGLQYNDFDSEDDGGVSGFTLYGNTVVNQIGLGAFISSGDPDDGEFESDIAYGIGASYDIGGATVAGTVQRTFDEETYADVGVSFSF